LVKALVEACSYIHFACHGAFDKEKPLDSALLLQPFDMSDYDFESVDVNDPDITHLLKKSDGKLTLGEIIRDFKLSSAPLRSSY
jgi:hypothetical protein